MRSKHSDAAVLLRRLSPTILLARCTRCQFCGGGHFSASPLPLARRGLLLFSPRGGGGPSNVYFSSPLAPIGWMLPTLQTCQSSISRGRQAHSPRFFLVVFFLLAGGTERDCGLAQLRSGGFGGEYFETREWMSAEERRMWSVNSPCRRDKQRQPSPEGERADTRAFLNFL